MAMKKIRSMVNAYNIEAIIGNGTGFRETEFSLKIALTKPVHICGFKRRFGIFC